MIEFLVYLLTIAGIWGLLSLSLNLQYGQAGLVNIGQIVFFMLGAYGSAIIVEIAHQPVWLGMLGGAAAAALFGVLIALPTARLQADYWAISTLAAAEIVRLIFLNTSIGSPFVGQSYGINGIDRPFRQQLLADGMSTATYNLLYLAFVLVILALAFFFLRWLARTPFGRTLKAIREGDEVPLALGKRVGSFRIRVMAIAGAIGGVAGAVFAHYNSSINPEYFFPIETFIIWAMVILGGAGNFIGALVGTFLIQVIYNSTRFIAPYLPFDPRVTGSLRMILIGVIILLVILFLPKGLFPERRRRFDR